MRAASTGRIAAGRRAPAPSARPCSRWPEQHDRATCADASARPSSLPCRPMDERVLAERLITYDTSTPDGLRAAAGFVKGWLEARDIDVARPRLRGPAGRHWPTSAPTRRAPTVILHGHLDVVPATREQFEPRVEGDRLIGRGAYDMKGALAAMMCAVRDAADQDRGARALRLRRPTRSPRTSSTARPTRSSRGPARRLRDHRRAHRPAHRRPGQGRARDPRRGGRARPPTARRRGSATTRSSRPTTRSGASRPCRSAASPPTSSTGPRSTSRASSGGDAFNKVPDALHVDVDIRYLPDQDPGEILAEIRAIADVRDRQDVHRARRRSSRATQPVRPRAARRGRRGSIEGEALSVGRDGASDADLVPRGRHPGGRVRPDRRRPPRPDGVGLDRSLERYRQALGDFIARLPAWLENASRQPARRGR